MAVASQYWCNKTNRSPAPRGTKRKAQKEMHEKDGNNGRMGRATTLTPLARTARDLVTEFGAHLPTSSRRSGGSSEYSEYSSLGIAL